jgi:hypothetical protein
MSFGSTAEKLLVFAGSTRPQQADEQGRATQRLATLIAEDAALHAEIFGAEFARAYASVALAPASHSAR